MYVKKFLSWKKIPLYAVPARTIRKKPFEFITLEDGTQLQ